jgi:transketolase
LKSTRDAYGETLVKLGKENPDIVVLDADLSASTKTQVFAKAFPHRFFNMGIAEANMMGVAAGLAQSGKIVFASTFTIFATGRAYDQIRQSICYPGYNVKIVASHGGLTVGPDGASHQALEDIALMRVIPNMTVIVPCDAKEAGEAVKAAVKHQGPVYIRTGREEVPDVIPSHVKFEIGKGSVIFGDESLDKPVDVSFIACGIMAAPAIQAAEVLQEKGLSCLVASFASVKPIDECLLRQLARRSKAIVTAEEHSVIGGLGGAVCEYIAENCPVPVIRVGVRDEFGQSGKAKELLQVYGLTTDGLISAAGKALALVT